MGERQHLRAVPSGSRYDVVIVGASIAGCTAATLYGRSGLSVALLERSADPDSYKTLCTHIIQPCAEATIERLGLGEEIARAGGVRPRALLWARWGWIRRPAGASSDRPSRLYSIRREKLDPILRDLAASTPGVDLLMGHMVTDVVREGDRVSGVVARNPAGASTEVRGRLVVAADGRHSPVAGFAGVGSWRIPNRRSGYWAYYTGVDHGDDPGTKLWLLEPDVGYVLPTDNDVTLLACMFPRKRLSWFRQDLAGNLERVVANLPDAPDLSQARRISKVLGQVNLPSCWRRRPPPGLLFTGDAQVAADPLFGVGCGWAFQSGAWLADATTPALLGTAADATTPALLGTAADATTPALLGKTADATTPALVGKTADATAPALADGSSVEALDRACRSYRRTVRKHLAGHWAMTSEYGTGRPFNPAEKALFSAATKDDRIAETMHDFGYRTIPVRSLVNPVVLGRAIRVNLTQRSPRAAKARPFEPPSHASGPVQAGAPVRTGALVVDGVRSPCLEAGPPDATEAVVFVHGNPGSSADWEPLIRATGTFARAVAIDHPGFGRADKPAGFDYTVAGYGDHLERALRRLGIRRAHLVLHDAGGPWGLEWAARHPEALASLVLMDAGILLGYRWHPLARIWQTPGVGEVFMASASRPGFRALLKVGQPTPLPRLFVDRMYDDFDKGTKRAVLRLYRASRDVESFSRSQANRLAGPLAADPRPVLVVWGRHDPYLPVEQAYRQADLFPGAEVVVLDHSGHFLFADDPEGVEAVVVPFLRRVVGERREVEAASPA